MIKNYRKKPVVIQAIQYLKGVNEREVINFTEQRAFQFKDGLEIPTLEGNHLATNGDFVIKGVKGEFYPCKPDIFEQTYELVEE